MTWVPPFFTCGECGGEIGRWPMKNLLRQDILDWRHRTVPDGVGEHRAVLGTPVPLAEIRLVEEPAEVEETPDPVPAPEVPARPAMYDELPPSARTLDKHAAAAGWAVEAWYMRGPLMDARWRFNRTVSSVVLRMVRDGHGVVASWQTKTDGSWAFDFGFSIGHYSRMVSSPELTALIKAPRAVCDSCGEPPALHTLTPEGYVCHDEFLAANRWTA